MTKWWVLVLYFIVLCSSLNKGKKSSISDSAQNVKAWHESWCIIIINLTFIVETMEQEVWGKSWRVKIWDNRNHQAGFLPKLMMMTDGNGDPFKNTTVTKVNQTDLRHTSVTKSELRSFARLSLLPFPMRKKAWKRGSYKMKRRTGGWKGKWGLSEK